MTQFQKMTQAIKSAFAPVDDPCYIKIEIQLNLVLKGRALSRGIRLPK